MIRIGSVEDVAIEPSVDRSTEVPADRSWPTIPRQRGAVESGTTTP